MYIMRGTAGCCGGWKVKTRLCLFQTVEFECWCLWNIKYICFMTSVFTPTNLFQHCNGILMFNFYIHTHTHTQLLWKNTLAINNLLSPLDAFDFSDDSISSATEGQKGSRGGDKSKDSLTGFKKIFSGPKKVQQSCDTLNWQFASSLLKWEKYFALWFCKEWFSWHQTCGSGLARQNTAWDVPLAWMLIVVVLPCREAHLVAQKNTYLLLLWNAYTFWAFHHQFLLWGLFGLSSVSVFTVSTSATQLWTLRLFCEESCRAIVLLAGLWLFVFVSFRHCEILCSC